MRNPVSGRWIRLRPPPGSIILNVGDYLQVHHRSRRRRRQPLLHQPCRYLLHQRFPPPNLRPPPTTPAPSPACHLLQRISNDMLPSTTHRVAAPDGSHRGARTSSPLAIYLREHEVLSTGLNSAQWPLLRTQAAPVHPGAPPRHSVEAGRRLPRPPLSRPPPLKAFFSSSTRPTQVLSVLPGLGEPRYEDVSAIDFHVGVMAKYYGEDYRQTGED